MRPGFPDIFMRLAQSLSERSTCLRGTKVGCVIVSTDHRQVYAIGYNGNATGLANHCDRTGVEAVGNCGCLHAEENAVISCDVPRATPKVVFCTHLPCVACAKRLIQLGGVKEVVYETEYRKLDAKELLISVGIEVSTLIQARIDDLITRWHKHEFPEHNLAQTIGLTDDEYATWVERVVLPVGYEKRRWFD